MPDIKTENFFTKKTKGLAYKIFSYFENNNNADFHTNGENRFLKSFLKKYQNSEVTLFDVGANVGKYSEMLLKYCTDYNIRYRIFIFEPVRASLAVLREKFAGDPGIIINAFGLSDERKTAEIFYDKAGSSLASLYQRELSQANIFLRLKENIELITLEGYMEEHQINKIDFLKIDVEGHEIPAFTGMGKFLHGDCIRAIQFEYGGANIDSRTFLKNIYQLLELRGYDIYKIKRNHLEPRTYDVRMENFAYANYVALNKQA
jgi:FkbM family methyltransferase